MPDAFAVDKCQLFAVRTDIARLHVLVQFVWWRRVWFRTIGSKTGCFESCQHEF